LVKGFPVYTTEFKGEFVTPTGAAILTTLAQRSGAMKPLFLEKIGLGAGKRDREFPNVLRCFLGKLANDGQKQNTPTLTNRDPYPQQHQQPPTPEGYHENSSIVLEANIDDMNPQLYGNLMEKLLASGALDVTLTPTQMKKNRPAIILQVISPPEIAQNLINVVFRESSTIGIRSYPVTKHMLHREIIPFKTVYGEIKVKISRLNNQIITVTPEYESCLSLYRETGIPLKDIYAKALGDSQSILCDVGK
jgi:pyridinium-3,5-bisthiocarboxylic acid mononucleotide nickel chelatase